MRSRRFSKLFVSDNDYCAMLNQTYLTLLCEEVWFCFGGEKIKSCLRDTSKKSLVPTMFVKYLHSSDTKDGKTHTNNMSTVVDLKTSSILSKMPFTRSEVHFVTMFWGFTMIWFPN